MGQGSDAGSSQCDQRYDVEGEVIKGERFNPSSETRDSTESSRCAVKMAQVLRSTAGLWALHSFNERTLT